MKDQVQNEKKKYKRIGNKKEVLFKDDEWEFVKANAESMNLSTTKYIVKMSVEGKAGQNNISDISELTHQLG